MAEPKAEVTPATSATSVIPTQEPLRAQPTPTPSRPASVEPTATQQPMGTQESLFERKDGSAEDNPARDWAPTGWWSIRRDNK